MEHERVNVYIKRRGSKFMRRRVSVCIFVCQYVCVVSYKHSYMNIFIYSFIHCRLQTNKSWCMYWVLFPPFVYPKPLYLSCQLSPHHTPTYRYTYIHKPLHNQIFICIYKRPSIFFYDVLKIPLAFLLSFFSLIC